jgi:hypothetical protein
MISAHVFTLNVRAKSVIKLQWQEIVSFPIALLTDIFILTEMHRLYNGLFHMLFHNFSQNEVH